MPYFEKETIDEIKKIDLLSYLKIFEPDNLVYFNRDTYCTKEHDSLKISNGMWYWFSRGFGGRNALDYLIKVRDLSFMDAVIQLSDKVGIADNKIITDKKIEKKLILPKMNSNNKKVIEYLKSRGIKEEIINECISKSLLYEDIYHNVVFLGYDYKNNIKYAFIRGCNKTRFMKEAYGSNKAFSFKLDSEKDSNTLHLFESAIDLLSYASIYQDYYNDNLLSLAGIYQPQKNKEDSKLPLVLNYYLNQHPNIKEIHLHLDNDSAGRNATDSLLFLLKKKYTVYDDPAPYGKDFNDYLQYINIMKERGKER